MMRKWDGSESEVAIHVEGGPRGVQDSLPSLIGVPEAAITAIVFFSLGWGNRSWELVSEVCCSGDHLLALVVVGHKGVLRVLLEVLFFYLRFCCVFFEGVVLEVDLPADIFIGRFIRTEDLVFIKKGVINQLYLLLEIM
jgi:hypothetical protein